MSAESVALDHYRSRQRLIRAIAAVARDAWQSVSTANLAGSWSQASAPLMVTLTGAQLAAAQSADQYLTEVLEAQDIDPAAQGAVAARSLAGVASDGRGLDTLLERPMIATLTALGTDVAMSQALATGYATLDMIVRTQVADAGRVADQVALTSRKHVGGYVRMVVGRSCSRCIILAGRWYGYNAGFKRHPRCRPGATVYTSRPPSPSPTIWP